MPNRCYCIDSQIRARIGLIVAIAVMTILGALQPESYPVFRATILIPAVFFGFALLILGLPILLSERAEKHKLPLSNISEFLAHNNAIFVAIGLVFASVAFVITMHWSEMSIVERGIFLGASILGTVSAIRERFVVLSRHDSG